MMLKYCSIIITFCALKTSKDLMAAFDDEHGDSEKSVNFSQLPPKSDGNSNWISIYETVKEGEPLGLPVWTRVPTPRYETPKSREDFYGRDTLEIEQRSSSRVRIHFKNFINKIRGLLLLKGPSD